MNTFDIDWKQHSEKLLEKINLRKELLGTVRPCFYAWQPPDGSESELESNFSKKVDEDCIEYIDAIDPSMDFQDETDKYEKVFEAWAPYNERYCEEVIEDEADINVESLIFETAPEDFVYKCKIRREKRSTFPVFCLYFQQAPKKRTFLLAGKKSMLSKSGSYTISTDPENFTRKSPSYVGKLRSNLIGTKYTMYENGKNFQRDYAVEVAGVIYKENLFGVKGPRKFTVILPSVDENGCRTEIPSDKKPKDSVLSLHESFKKNHTDGIISFQNKTPTWDADKRSYVINFEGRVKRSSVKNFKLIRGTQPENLVMQFGKVTRDSFSLDYSYPLCALQAFGIALSSFDYKLACE